MSRHPTLLQWTKILCLPIALALIFFIGVSRVYLGVHSYSQVITGWAYGIILLIIYAKFFDQGLETLGRYIITGQKRLLMAVLLILCFAFCVGVSVIVYIATKGWDQQEIYIQRVIEACKESIDPEEVFFNRDFAASAVVAAIFGLLFGLFLIRNRTKDAPIHLNCLKELLRVLIDAAIVGGFVVGMTFVIKTTNNPWGYFGVGLFAYFTAGLLLIWLGPLIINLIGLAEKMTFSKKSLVIIILRMSNRLIELLPKICTFKG